jgi:hypothetical protein
MQKVGFVTSAVGNGSLEVWWNAATRKVWIAETGHLGKEEEKRTLSPDLPQWCRLYASTWRCEDDGPIVDTVACSLDAPSSRVTLTKLMIFDEAGRHGKAAPAQLLTDIYDCEWSDFACEHQVLHLEGAKEPAVVTTYAADMDSPENQALFLRSIQGAVARAEAAHAAGEEDWEDEFDDNDSEFGMPCPHSNNLALCTVCD